MEDVNTYEFSGFLVDAVGYYVIYIDRHLIDHNVDCCFCLISNYFLTNDISSLEEIGNEKLRILKQLKLYTLTFGFGSQHSTSTEFY